MPENLGQTDDFNDHFSKWRDWFSSHLVIIFLILAGIILISVGCFSLFRSSAEDDKIEIIPAAQVTTSQTLFADIAGEVVKPGVYELPFGSRINDLLIMAGGLSAKADREWVETNLNKAQKLKDGDKVYIPLMSERVKERESKSGTGIVSGTSTTTATLKININSASLAELDTLWGVGLVIGQKIIDNRPYQKIDDLVSKKVISKSTFQKISSQLSVY